jgi:hypothetical protein
MKVFAIICWLVLLIWGVPKILQIIREENDAKKKKSAELFRMNRRILERKFERDAAIQVATDCDIHPLCDRHSAKIEKANAFYDSKQKLYFMLSPKSICPIENFRHPVWELPIACTYATEYSVAWRLPSLTEAQSFGERLMQLSGNRTWASKLPDGPLDVISGTEKNLGRAIFMGIRLKKGFNMYCLEERVYSFETCEPLLCAPYEGELFKSSNLIQRI